MFHAQVVSALLAAAGIACKLAISALLPATVTGLLFIPAVLASTYLAGWWSGLISITVSTFALFLLSLAISPLGVIWSNIFVFVAVALVAAWLAASLREEKERTQRVLADLVEREAFLKSLLDGIPDAVLAVAPDGAVLSQNTGAPHLFDPEGGRSLVGRNIRALLPDLPLVPGRPSMTASVTPEGEAVRVRRLDGSPFAGVVSVGSWGGAEPCNRTLIVRDVSRRQELLRRLRQAEDELARMMRAAEHHEVVSLLAHELNQPLAAMVNYLRGARNLLESGGTDATPRLEEVLELATDQAMRASRTIYQMRDLLVSGSAPRADEAIEPLVQEALDIALAGFADDPPFRVIDAAAPGALVHVDRLQMQLVLVNVIRNALEAMRGGATRMLTIRTSAGEGRAVIRIMDTGPGIDAEIAGRLFHPLATTKPDGMGIGLSIARQIVEAHAGTVAIRNRPGGGAECVIDLPLSVAAEVAHA